MVKNEEQKKISKNLNFGHFNTKGETQKIESKKFKRGRFESCNI